MGQRCFISYKSQDKYYRDKILKMGLDISLVPAAGAIYYGESCSPEELREYVFPDSTVTIYLIGEHSGESDGPEKQKYIRKELQASLCAAQDGFCSAILGVVLPGTDVYVFNGSRVVVDDSTVLREFSSNYGPAGNGCCLLLSWDDFKSDPEKYVGQAHAVRSRMKGDTL